jgi:hypothetical protein
MDFIIRDIPKTSTTSSSASYSGGAGSSGVAQLNYLPLIAQTSNLISNGIIQLPTSLNSLFGSVTGSTATYFKDKQGWIFNNSTKNVASIDNKGKFNVGGLELLNDTKTIDLSINADGNMLISGSDMTDKPVIQSIIDGVYQDLLINPNGGNVSINTEYSEGYQLNVNGTVKTKDITINGGTHNNVLATNPVDGSFTLNGQPLGARIYKIDELLSGTFSSEDISNSVNAYVGKNLLQRVTAIETTGSQPAFNGTGFVKVNVSTVSYDNNSYYVSGSNVVSATDATNAQNGRLLFDEYNGGFRGSSTLSVAYAVNAGSSINSDKLGGQLASYYLPYRTFGSAANSNTDQFINMNWNRFTGDANTLGLVNTTGVYNISSASNVPSYYGTLLGFWNGDISTQLYLGYNGDMSWRKSIGTSYTGSIWRTVWDSVNFNPANYLPLAGGSMNNTNMVNGLNAQYFNNQPINNFQYNSDNYYSNKDANTIIGGYGLNTTGNATGNSNFPYQYGSVMTYDLGYGRTQLNFRHDGELTIRSKWGDSWNTNRLVWDSVNFNPYNYLPLTGGNLTGQIFTSGKIITNDLFLNTNSTVGNSILINASGANYGAIQNLGASIWGLGTGGGGVDRNINNTALSWSTSGNVGVGYSYDTGYKLAVSSDFYAKQIYLDSSSNNIYTFGRVTLNNNGRIIYNNGTGVNMFFGELAANKYGFTTNTATDLATICMDLGNTRVGIGTSSPSSTLDVNGGGFYNGDLVVGNTSSPRTILTNNICGYGGTGTFNINPWGGSVLVNGCSVIHTGNISSQSVNYANTSAASNRLNYIDINNTPANQVEFYQSSANNPYNDNPTGSWATMFKMSHGDGNTYYNRRLAFPFWGNDVYVGGRTGGTETSWEKLIHSKTIGTFWTGTKAEFDALSKDANTMYIII